MTLNDLECPIHLKVRFTDGTLDVVTLWLSDSTIRTGIARGGGGGVGWRTCPPLHPCGQLTRCFSAVAELLVTAVVTMPVCHSVRLSQCRALVLCKTVLKLGSKYHQQIAKGSRFFGR